MDYVDLMLIHNPCSNPSEYTSAGASTGFSSVLTITHAFLSSVPATPRARARSGSALRYASIFRRRRFERIFRHLRAACVCCALLSAHAHRMLTAIRCCVRFVSLGLMPLTWAKFRKMHVFRSAAFLRALRVSEERKRDYRRAATLTLFWGHFSRGFLALCHPVRVV